MSLKTEFLAFVLRKTIADMVASEVKSERGTRMEQLLDLHEDTGAKQVAVKLPSGEQVATLTITQPSPKQVVDESRLLAWCKENRPDLVETVDHPATEAWTEERVNAEAFRRIEADVVDGDWITADGEHIDGIRTVTDAPSSFSVKYSKGGQDRIIDAWRSGELSSIEPGGTLPQIGA